jgi:hypothetical protein
VRRRCHCTQTACGTAWWRARRRLDSGKVLPEISRGPKGGAGQGGGGRGTPERWADGEAAQTVSGGGVQRRRG